MRRVPSSRAHQTGRPPPVISWSSRVVHVEPWPPVPSLSDIDASTDRSAEYTLISNGESDVSTGTPESPVELRAVAGPDVRRRQLNRPTRRSTTAARSWSPLQAKNDASHRRGYVQPTRRPEAVQKLRALRSPYLPSSSCGGRHIKCLRSTRRRRARRPKGLSARTSEPHPDEKSMVPRSRRSAPIRVVVLPRMAISRWNEHGTRRTHEPPSHGPFQNRFVLPAQYTRAFARSAMEGS